MRVKVSILGHFGEGANLLNGQTVKTKIITEELQNQLGQDQVMKIDTHGGWKTFLKAPFQVFRALKNSTNVLIFPAQNGLRVFTPLLAFIKRIFKKRKIHYVVIGGWLPQFLMHRKRLSRILRKFDGIYVETNTMRSALEAQGFENIFVMPNCKELTPISMSELVYQNEIPYRLCTFSRVMKEKGIEDAVDVVKSINLEYGKTIYSLDIYGQVDPSQIEWFDNLKTELPDYIKYCGLVPFDKSVEVLKNYFALLFPTRFYTEGIPGTIIDAYAAGIPVISSRWQSFDDIVEDGITGVGFEFGNIENLKKILIEVYLSPDEFNKKKENSLNKSKSYIPSEVIKVIIRQLR